MRKTITAAIMAAVTTAAVGGAGIAAASTHSAGSTGTEHFQLMNTLPAGTTASVIASGVFTAAAVAHELPNNVQSFVFPNGTMRVRHSNPTGPQTLNPKTCLLTANLHGTYRILGGTGKYAGIRGHGTYRFSILSLGARSAGKCSQSKLPVALHEVVNTSGPVTLHARVHAPHLVEQHLGLVQGSEVVDQVVPEPWPASGGGDLQVRVGNEPLRGDRTRAG